MLSYRFSAKKRIKSRKKFEQIFAAGNRIAVSPFHLLHVSEKLIAEENPLVIGISVPKKRFKKAVERNLLKRRIREAVRLNLPAFEPYFSEKKIKCNILFIYNTNDILSFKIIAEKIILSLQRLKEAYA